MASSFARRWIPCSCCSRVRFSAVIFDMDGVLVDTEPLHFAAMNDVLARENREITSEQFLDYLGLSASSAWADLAARLHLTELPPFYVAAYVDRVSSRLIGPLAPAPGLLPLLETLQRRQVPCAVASSSPQAWVDRTLSALGLANWFNAVVSGDQVQAGKPDPEIYRLAAHRLGRTPPECIAVEDAPSGVASARAAGCHVLALLTRYVATARLSAAHASLASLDDFPLDALAPPAVRSVLAAE